MYQIIHHVLPSKKVLQKLYRKRSKPTLHKFFITHLKKPFYCPWLVFWQVWVVLYFNTYNRLHLNTSPTRFKNIVWKYLKLPIVSNFHNRYQNDLDAFLSVINQRLTCQMTVFIISDSTSTCQILTNGHTRVETFRRSNNC